MGKFHSFNIFVTQSSITFRFCDIYQSIHLENKLVVCTSRVTMYYIYVHRTCYRFSKSPRYTARARIRTKRCIPVDIRYSITLATEQRYVLDVSYGCIRYISVFLIVSCVLLVVVSLQRPYFFFRAVVSSDILIKIRTTKCRATDISEFRNFD